MPTYKQILNYAKKEVLWKEEYLERYYKREAENLRKGLERIYQSNDDIGLMINAGFFCWRMTSNARTIYFDSCYKTGKSDNQLLCKNLALMEIELVCEHFDIREEKGYTYQFSQLGENWLALFACNRFDLIQHCYPAIMQWFNSGMYKNLLRPGRYPQKLGVLAMEMIAREHGDVMDWEELEVPVDPFYLHFCRETLQSQDEEQVKAGLVELCDKHLEWADFHNSDKRCYLTGYEIQRQELMLWPFEYQAVKFWRARRGLSTPIIEHPLMETPMAIEHIPDFHAWQRPEWFNSLLDFIAQRKPELSFLKTLSAS